MSGFEAGERELHTLAEELRRRYPEIATDCVAVVDVGRQCLHLIKGGKLLRHYRVSTAARGVGQREGSFQTPLGVFRVAGKFGAEAPAGMVFKGRRATGEIAEILSDPHDPAENDLVTTRILWLDGLQPGYNRGGDVDTYARYIYIHGTPEEGRIGMPVSHGCVRMRNDEVVDLFERLPQGSLVCILPGDAPLSEIPGPRAEAVNKQ
ncbi:MAG: L,D-transpeptidase [Acidihalobacter sp.]|uniref:L,D-transpeptidase n=1 Tax=Acidihalobacter sp. TaxID=1872108 RepID=UPI00307DF2F9